jgi:Pyruvate/2-oxoacid:ferredoxin oxidoreductase delta subunit
MWEILDDVTSGRATPEQLDLLETLAEVVKDTSMCGLGQTASTPVLSTLRYFRGEYMEHIERRYCPASVCRDLFVYRVVVEKCPGCGLCLPVCPTDAIAGEKKKAHSIDPLRCSKCGACYDVCNLGAIVSEPVPEPVR